ncbi:MAG: formylglycine-generating enzyme family protein, partial [Tannerellaceae bacterium]
YTIKNLAVWGLEPTVPIPDGHFTRKFWDFVPRDKESNDGNLITVEGGKYKANPWGLFDMHGNVAEWTASECSEHPTYVGQKTVCGGSWRDRAAKSTAWTRRYFQPWQAPFNVGFRVIITD